MGQPPPSQGEIRESFSTPHSACYPRDAGNGARRCAGDSVPPMGGRRARQRWRSGFSASRCGRRDRQPKQRIQSRIEERVSPERNFYVWLLRLSHSAQAVPLGPLGPSLGPGDLKRLLIASRQLERVRATTFPSINNLFVSSESPIACLPRAQHPRPLCELPLQPPVPARR